MGGRRGVSSAGTAEEWTRCGRPVRGGAAPDTQIPIEPFFAFLWHTTSLMPVRDDRVRT